MSKKELRKDLHKAVQYVAAEFSYFKDLRKDLEQLKKDCEQALKKKELKDIKKALRDFRYISRVANREYNLWGTMQKELRKLIEESKNKTTFKNKFKKLSNGKATDSEAIILMKFNNNLSILNNKNTSVASRFEGSIKKDLSEIRAIIQANKNPKEELERLYSKIKDFMEWLSAMVIDYQKAEKIVNKILDRHLPELDVNIRTAKYLPKLDYTHKWKNYKARIIIRFDGYNPHETQQLLADFQGLTNELINPKQKNLFNLGSPFNKESEHLKSRIKDKIFLDANKFHNYALESIKKMFIKMVTENKELMICPSMTFIFKIYGINKYGLMKAFNASAGGMDNLGPNEKTINIGSVFLFLNLFFSEDFYTPIDKRFIISIMPKLEQIEKIQPGETIKKASSALQYNIQPTSLYQEGLYRDSAVYTTIYHELIHSIDPVVSWWFKERGIIFDILPNVIKKVYQKNLVLPFPQLRTLGDLFARARTEAITVFSEFFIKTSKHKYQFRNFMATFPLKETAYKILNHFKFMSSRFTYLSEGKQPDLFRKKEPEIRKEYGHPFAYEMGYMMAMIIALDYIFRNNVDTIIVPKYEFFEKSKDLYPITANYLGGGIHGYQMPDELKEQPNDSLDKQLFIARKNQNIKKIKQILVKAGVTLIDKNNFKKYYEKNTNFYIYRFDKRHARIISNKIKISQMNFYTLYDNACRRLNIESVFDESRMGGIFYRSVLEYNRLLKKKEILP
ncbi:hypothetical protein HOA91_02105 [Candidatus Woesearchaeota archaeon]|jgi:hypothetical protein|nr:hypothetical protein [Candidatus Woesearchaeota archaeon]